MNLRIVTWNIRHGGGTRISALLRILESISADTVILTEFRNNVSGDLLQRSLSELGYSFRHTGQSVPRENSLMIASRHNLAVGLTDQDHLELDPRRCVHACNDSLRYLGVYFACGAAKEPLFKQLLNATTNLPQTPGVLLGDFNTGKHYMDEVGKTFICEKYMDLLASNGWTDAWRLMHGDAREYSWYSHAGRGFRIDHAFITSDLRSSVRACNYLHEYRTPEYSDHAPMLLSLEF